MPGDESRELLLMLLKIGNETYAVELTKIREVVKASSIVRVPHSNPMVEGVMNLRGKVVPLIDLASYLGTSAESKNKILIYSLTDGKELGFVVDHVLGVARVDKRNVQSAEFGQLSPVIKGFFVHDGSLIPILDLDRIAQEIASSLGDIHV